MMGPVTLPEILAAREQRVQQQQTLLGQYGKTLLVFTMNIAGPIKYSEQIHWGFNLGNRWISIQLSDLPIVHRSEVIASTGCEAYYVIDASADLVKRRAVQIEDSAPVARLFDLDVLDSAGKKLDRVNFNLPPRTCLICDNPAHLCGRSRAHSVAQLQKKTEYLLTDAMVEADCAYIAQLAQKSLLYEVCTTPKPGLVDCRNSGSHTDMDIFTFLSGSAALAPYFTQCARLGATTRDLPPKSLFDKLRFAGKLAENAMYEATNGVNTHKGCIFSLGILCAAAGRLSPAHRKHCIRLPVCAHRKPDAILSLCREMTQGLVQEDFQNITEQTAATVGETLYTKYGISGIRGQAESGFPQVLQVSLPVLEKGLSKGLSLNDAGCAALLALIASVTDTNLIHRSNPQRQAALAKEIQTILQQQPYPSRDTIQRLDEQFIAENLSPGGCADLLAITYFLHFINNQREETL